MGPHLRTEHGQGTGIRCLPVQIRGRFAPADDRRFRGRSQKISTRRLPVRGLVVVAAQSAGADHNRRRRPGLRASRPLQVVGHVQGPRGTQMPVVGNSVARVVLGHWPIVRMANDHNAEVASFGRLQQPRKLVELRRASGVRPASPLANRMSASELAHAALANRASATDNACTTPSAGGRGSTICGAKAPLHQSIELLADLVAFVLVIGEPFAVDAAALFDQGQFFFGLHQLVFDRAVMSLEVGDFSQLSLVCSFRLRFLASQAVNWFFGTNMASRWPARTSRQAPQASA